MVINIKDDFEENYACMQEGGCMLSDGLGPRAGGYSEAVSVVVSTDAAGTAWTVL